MWILMILALAGMSALTIAQTPREWLRRRVPRTLLLTYHAIGVTSIALILFAVYRMRDGFWRELIVWTETFYIAMTMYALLLSAVRYLGFELARHFRHARVLRILGSHAVFYLTVVAITALYMVPAVHNATTLRTVTYDVEISKPCADETLSVAVVSDFHIGGGARHSEIDQMTQLLADARPDVILIDGDICDSSSSLDDLAYLESALGTLECRYGVFYAEGNHEQECRYDPTPYLLRAGVTILKDEGVRLENGLNIVGRRNALEVDAAQIMADSGLSGLSTDDPTVVLQHRTRGLHALEGVADVAICGHTHGYPFPFMGILEPYLREISYGRRSFGGTEVIVSAGVAEWGYRTKWPSQSEITLVNLHFEEARQ